MNIEILTKIITDGGMPSGEQMRRIDVLVNGPEPVDDLLKIATNEFAPIEVRNWCWNLLALATLPAWYFRQGDLKWTEVLPDPLPAQAVAMHDMLDNPRGGQPRFPGNISWVPFDSLERVWGLLTWRLDKSLNHAHIEDWGKHIIVGSLKVCYIQAPKRYGQSQVFRNLQDGGRETFRLIWDIMIDPKIPDWVRRSFIRNLLDAGPDKLPDDYSSLSGLGNRSEDDRHCATARFAHSIARRDKWTPEMELCVEELFSWLWRTMQKEELMFMARWGTFGHDVLKLLYRVDRSAFQEILWMMLTLSFPAPKDCQVVKEFAPSNLHDDFLFLMRSFVQHVGDQDDITSRIDELLMARQEGKRAEQLRSHSYKLEEIEEMGQKHSDLAAASNAQHELIHGLIEQTTNSG